MDRAALFQSIGLSEKKAQETLRNDSLSARLESVIVLVIKVDAIFTSDKPWNLDFFLFKKFFFTSSWSDRFFIRGVENPATRDYRLAFADVSSAFPKNVQDYSY